MPGDGSVSHCRNKTCQHDLAVNASIPQSAVFFGMQAFKSRDRAIHSIQRMLLQVIFAPFALPESASFAILRHCFGCGCLAGGQYTVALCAQQNMRFSVMSSGLAGITAIHMHNLLLPLHTLSAVSL